MATKNENVDLRVNVTLPRARRGEIPEQFVGINGVNYVIPKGKAVEVPDFVAAEIKRAQAAAEFMEDEKEAMLSKDTV